jgi:predicted nuclease of predicted toxin-antitoxin system
MKLLFDQNISFRIINKIALVYPNSEQVRRLQLENSSDLEIWTFAKNNNYTIITFDSDFFDLTNLYGHPPKIIWLKTGNTSTKEIAQLLINKVDLIKEFVENDEIACLEIE